MSGRCRYKVAATNSASFLEGMVLFDPANAKSAALRALFRLRLRLGALFGWDDATKKRPLPGGPERTLSARPPDDLRGSAKTPVIGDFLQRPALYRCIAPRTNGLRRSRTTPCMVCCLCVGRTTRRPVSRADGRLR